MTFNFDEIVDRNNTSSIKWSAAPSQDILPMWVADMDFKTAPAVIEALQSRVAHGVFGYTQTPPEFYSAIINWWKRWHGFTLEKDWILPASGVIPALSAAVRALTKKGDRVLLQPPVYNHFYITLQNCGCGIVENNLVYSDGNYTIDFDDLENKAADPGVKLLIISNPHNPAGRVWTKEELQRIGDICLKNDVIVISDEIHSDLVISGFTHVPFASLGKSYSANSITLSSPTKTFNLAGLQVGYLFTENKEFKQAIQKILTLQEMELLSPFAITTLIAAYNEGEAWLEALKSYLHDNYLFLKDYIATHFPEVTVTPLQATYLVWLDCSALKKSSEEISEQLLKEHKLWINPGTMYGHVGEGFLRVNIACPRKLLNEGLDRLLQGLTEA
jgi:cysteine-S-conjugate beta-lyase